MLDAGVPWADGILPCDAFETGDDRGWLRLTADNFEYMEREGRSVVPDLRDYATRALCLAVLARRVGLDPERIYVSCFIGDPAHGIPKDTESAAIWTGLFSAAGVSADQVVFMDHGVIVEEAAPAGFFENASSARARQFLSQILTH